MIMKINWTYIACLSLTILTGCSGDDIFAPDHIWSAGKQGGLLVTNRDKKEIYLIDANFNKTGTARPGKRSDGNTRPTYLGGV